jgi:hypothetical protein
MYSPDLKARTKNRRHLYTHEPVSDWREVADEVLGTKVLAQVWPHELVRSCVSCGHFTADETCTKNNKLRPPAKVIAFGCDSYSDNDAIPF